MKNPFGSFQTNPQADAWWVALIFFLKKHVFVVHPNEYGFSALDFLPHSPLTSDQQLVMVHHFLERQAAFNDVDFSNVDDDVPLLLNAIQLNRLHYADILLDCSSYHPSPAELATARDILTQGSANKETLLYKIKIKEERTKEDTHKV